MDPGIGRDTVLGDTVLREITVPVVITPQIRPKSCVMKLI